VADVVHVLLVAVAVGAAEEEGAAAAACGCSVQLRPLRDGAHFAAGDVQELQVLLQEFNLRGNRIRDLILGILQLLVGDGEGERVSTEELQAMVKLPEASSLYDQARIMGHVQEARHARFIKESPFYSISADAGDVAGEKRNFMVVSGHLAALGYGVLCRMRAVHLISGSVPGAVQRMAASRDQLGPVHAPGHRCSLA
jgi:hypothetical protein